MQPSLERQRAESAFHSLQNLLKAGQELAGQAGYYYAKSGEYAGHYWVYIKENDGAFTKVALCAVGVPLLYNNYGSVALGLGCAILAPHVIPDLFQKIKGVWNDTDFGKLALCTAGFICVEWNPWPFTAFGYGAYIGSKVRSIAPEAPSAEATEPPKQSPGMVEWLWKSVFVSKAHAE